MIDNRSIQRALRAAGLYNSTIDGDFGPKSKAARSSALSRNGIRTEGWSEDRLMLAISQWTMKQVGIDPGPIDGLMGPATRYALEAWQDYMRDKFTDDTPPTGFPTQRGMDRFYGAPGTNHTLLTLPYPMRLAWDKSVVVNRVTINKKCADSAEQALEKALLHYGFSELQDLGLDLFGGCYNNRKMRGGSSLSTHAYAAALDIDPEHNQLRWGRDQARMARPEYKAFLDAFEAEGWVSLGRERNYDWMHLQAVRL